MTLLGGRVTGIVDTGSGVDSADEFIGRQHPLTGVDQHIS